MGERRPTKSERIVASALSEQLLPGEFILEGIRFSDEQHGDVECDVLVFCPGYGIAAIEVKGGIVEFADGQWTVETGSNRRRVNPVDQARRAKHALRKYLNRQPEWALGLVRCEWFVALPFTEVNSDLGTEGRRDLLIGKQDIDTAMQRIRTALDSAFHEEVRPTSDQLEQARNLILRSGNHPSRSSASSHSRWRVIATLFGITSVTATAGYLVSTLESPASMVAVNGAAVAIGATISLWLTNRPKRRLARVGSGVAASLIGIALSTGVASTYEDSKECNSNYSGCVPIATDVDCADLENSVQVIGQDVYKLDRDGDGRACEWNEPSPSASN